MELPTNTLVINHIIKALCNTLVHSLWQGILLAVAGGIIIIFTKKTSAVYRYNLLIAAMILFTAGTVFTFLWQLCEPQSNTVTYIGYTTTGNSAISAPVISIQLTGTPAIQRNPKESITEKVISYFNTHYNAIVLIWFLIICAKSVQMAVGLHNVFHLKRTKVFAVNKYWENKFLQLTKQLQIKQAVSLLESGIAKVPMVIGHLKPIILIPVGLINSLSTKGLEAILIHELTHIRRRDYLVNLLQSFMEIVFFFNPAVLWISRLIKTERENCCDDLALQQSSDKVNYIRALVSCEEYQLSVPAYAMASTGGKNTLLGRVKRMVTNRNHSLNMFEKTVLAVCLVVFGLGVSAFMAREDIKKAVNTVVAAIHHDLKGEHKEQVKAVENDTTVKPQEAAINSTVVLLNQLRHPANTDTGKQAGLLSLIMRKIDSLRGNEGKLNSPLALLAKLDTGSFNKFHEIGQELYREHLITDTNHLNISLNEKELIVNGVRMPEEVHERIYRQFGGSNVQPYENKHADPYNAVPEDRSKEIGYELVRDNLVKDKSHFTYKLSKDELFIDGVKQPEELHRRIVDEYFKTDDNFNISYTFKDPGLDASRSSAGNYQRQGDEQKRYWAGQERKIIDEMAREGLVNYRKDVSFTLTTKTFVINGMVQSGEVFQRYRNEYIPSDAKDNWTWSYNGPGSYPTDAYRGRDWDAYSRQTAAERQRVEAERDKKLVADLLQDGLITDPNNVTFSLSDKKLMINEKKQSDDIYNKYKDKYMPDNTGSGWNWNYSHHE